MLPESGPERGSTHEEEKQARLRLVGRIAGFALLMVAVFLLGYFFVGPKLSRARGSASSVESVATGPDVEVVPTLPPNAEPAPPRPLAEVTITERPSAPADPAKADTVAPPTPAPTDVPVVSPVPDVPSQTPPPESPALQQPSEGSLYHVRAGLFIDRSRADALAGKLTAAGFTPAVCCVDVAGKSLYSVQLGAFKDRARAKSLADEVLSSGFESTIVTGD